jgi:hypothetical protein
MLLAIVLALTVLLVVADLRAVRPQTGVRQRARRLG